MTDDVMEAAAALEAVLSVENAALVRLDFATAVALMPVKEAALARLSGLSLPTLSEDTDPALVELAQRLGSLTRANRSLLEQAIAIQTRIVGIIVGAAQAVPTPAGYAATGQRIATRRPSAMALSARA